MNYTLKLEQFEGPLELLLKLIEDEKLDITTISLAKITDQYLQYLERHDVLPADEVADFLVVAAKLIYIKSRCLVPNLVAGEEDGDDLEEQLKVYREYYEASKVVAHTIARHRFSYARENLMKQFVEVRFSPPTNLKLASMPQLLRGVIGRIETMLKLPLMQLKRMISIKEKIKLLLHSLEEGILNFRRFCTGDKQDAIVSFLALLELVKMRHIAVEQSALFADIVIRKNGVYG